MLPPALRTIPETASTAVIRAHEAAATDPSGFAAISLDRPPRWRCDPRGRHTGARAPMAVMDFSAKVRIPSPRSDDPALRSSLQRPLRSIRTIPPGCCWTAARNCGSRWTRSSAVGARNIERKSYAGARRTVFEAFTRKTVMFPRCWSVLAIQLPKHVEPPNPGGIGGGQREGSPLQSPRGIRPTVRTAQVLVVQGGQADHQSPSSLSNRIKRSTSRNRHPSTSWQEAAAAGMPAAVIVCNAFHSHQSRSLQREAVAVSVAGANFTRTCLPREKAPNFGRPRQQKSQRES